MKYALLILEDPIRDTSSKSALANCVNQVVGLTKETQQVQVLNEGALLFPLEHGLNALSHCVYDAKSRGIHSRTLFFDHDPAWVIS